MNFAAVVLRVVLTTVFGWAALSKIADPRALFDAILTYRLVGPPIAAPLSLLLPWLELTAATALWLPRARVAARVWLAALLVVFIAALLQGWWRGLDVVCGCFGGKTATNAGAYVGLLARDLVLLAVVAALAALENKAGATPRAAPACKPD